MVELTMFSLSKENLAKSLRRKGEVPSYVCIQRLHHAKFLVSQFKVTNSVVFRACRRVRLFHCFLRQLQHSQLLQMAPKAAEVTTATPVLSESS